MKTQLSSFYAERKSIIIAALTASLILVVPFSSLIYGLMIYCSYQSISLIAVLPALTVWQAMMLAIPFAAAKLVFIFREYRTFTKKRKMLKDAFRIYEKHNALRR